MYSWGTVLAIWSSLGREALGTAVWDTQGSLKEPGHRPRRKSLLARRWPGAEACWCLCTGLPIAHRDVVAKLRQKTHGTEPESVGKQAADPLQLLYCFSTLPVLEDCIWLYRFTRFKKYWITEEPKSWRKRMRFSRKNYGSMYLQGNKILGLKSWLIQRKKELTRSSDWKLKVKYGIKWQI